MDSKSMLKKNWDELISKAEQKAKELQKTQNIYLRQLKNNIKKFHQDIYEFRKLYEETGPMVEGIPPIEAMERLRKFSNEKDVREKFYQINKRGEDLFGL